MLGEGCGALLKSAVGQVTPGMCAFGEGFFGVYSPPQAALQAAELKHMIESSSDFVGAKTVNIVMPSEPAISFLSKLGDFIDRLLTAGIGA